MRRRTHGQALAAAEYPAYGYASPFADFWYDGYAPYYGGVYGYGGYGRGGGGRGGGGHH